MSLPQIRAALAACDRRDAAVALQTLECVHAAAAPLAHKDGQSVFKRVADRLRSLILAKPHDGKATGRNAYKAMLAMAKAQDAARKVQPK